MDTQYKTLGILAHVDAGKTTVCEQLLVLNGAIREFGRVDKGLSQLDYDEKERARGITIYAKETVIQKDDTEITLLDTPGHVDFVWETLSCFRVMDMALLIMDASKPLDAHTKRLFFLLQKYNIPTILFLNKTDLLMRSKAEVIKELLSLDERIVDFSASQDERDENAALCDERLLEEYTKTDRLTDASLALAIGKGNVIPSFLGAALSGKGLDTLNEALFTYLSLYKNPSPEEAFVPYKVKYDADGSRLVYGRVGRESLFIKGVLESEKIDEIRRFRGSKYDALQEAKPGMMVALRGLRNIGVNSTYEEAFRPLLQYELIVPDKVSAMKSLSVLTEEYPLLNLHFDARTDRLLLSPMGDIQLEILREEIQNRFSIDAEFLPAGVVYKERVASAVEGVGHFEPLRHYAEVHLLIEPNPGEGLVIRNALTNAQLPENFQKQVMHTLKETAVPGTKIGAALTDTKISLIAGKAHDKHTEGGDFREATLRALRQGLMRVGTCLLEPHYAFTLTLPKDCVGAAMVRLDAMAAETSGPIYDFSDGEGDAGTASISGTFPAVNLEDFPIYITQLAKGAQSLSLSHGGYFAIDRSSEEELMASFSYDAVHDTDYPASSVFTDHGGSVTIPFDQVSSHMHIPFIYENGIPSVDDKDKSGHAGDIDAWYATRDGADGSLGKSTSEERFIGTDEIDRIIVSAGGANKRKHKDDRGSHWNRYTKQADAVPVVGKVPYTPGVSAHTYVLVDGYNIIFSWDELHDLAEREMDAAKDRLIDILSEYAAFTKYIVILVFDAYKVSGGVGSVTRQKGIDIIYTKEAETADSYIEKTSRTLAKENMVRVATSDRLEQMIIWGDGALPMSAREFLAEVNRTKEEIRNLIRS